MADFSEIVPIGDVLRAAGIPYEGRNFEELYSQLSEEPGLAEIRAQLEELVHAYFSALELPPEPTIYDVLLLSLRPKDVLATFNWDPFVVRALDRTRFIRGREHPRLAFLHGNVCSGYCRRDNVHGRPGILCSRCGEPFVPSRLLFPVAHKNYEGDPEIADAWRFMSLALKKAFMVTVFGYGAPKSDVAAMNLLRTAWGPRDQRQLEEFEIVDVREEEVLLDPWKDFVFSHHYLVHSEIYDSWLFNHPRRSGEAYWNQFMNAYFIENNAVPRGISWEQLENWFGPLLRAEARAAQQGVSGLPSSS